MRRKFLSIGLALVLSMGLATAAVADTDGSVTAQEQTDDDNGDAGLWGLLGLLGLAGLAGLKRDDRHTGIQHDQRRGDNR